jgi:glutathione S-transferase
MYELYIANKNYSSWSMRPWVLMRGLGLPFAEHMKPFTEKYVAGEFRSFSPSGRVPCLVDGSQTVWDSLAIVDYLAERHPGVWPSAADARAWARCAAAEMHSGFSALRNQCSMSVGVRVRLHSMDDSLKADLVRIEELWAEGLSRHGGPFLGGARFSAVDAFYAPVATRVQTYNLPVNDVSKAYVARLLAFPAVAEWIEAGIAETWRDPPHDRDVLAAGTVLQDLRRKTRE